MPSHIVTAGLPCPGALNMAADQAEPPPHGRRFTMEEFITTPGFHEILGLPDTEPLPDDYEWTQPAEAWDRLAPPIITERSHVTSSTEPSCGDWTLLDFALERTNILGDIYDHTGRNTLLLFSGHGMGMEGNDCYSCITDSDVDGVKEACRDMDVGPLDLLVQSPGGDLASVEQIVDFLHGRFPHVRAIVPRVAKDAAAMLALAADEILMAGHSFFTPALPKFYDAKPEGVHMRSSHIYLKWASAMMADLPRRVQEQFWHHHGERLVRVDGELARAQEVLAGWLRAHLLHGTAASGEASQALATWLATAGERLLNASLLRDKGLPIGDLHADHRLYDLVMKLHSISMREAGLTSCAKLLCAHTGTQVVTEFPV